MIQCEECGKSYKVITDSHLKNKCLGNIKSISEYREKYPNSQLMSDETAKSHAVTEKSMIAKYGEIEGLQKWNEYRDKQAYTCSFEYFKQTRGWSQQEFEKFNASRAITENNLINKYGEEKGKLKWDEYCLKQSINGNTIEYFQQKYGDELGSQKYQEVCSKKARTFENFKIKYGEELGHIEYQKYKQKQKIFYKSQIASEFIIGLIELLPSSFRFHEGVYGKEFCVYSNNKPNFYDFVITHPIKACIEFNGDYWHANPNLYKADDIIEYPNNRKKVVKDIWEYDRIKNESIISRGYAFKIIWETEYNTNKQNTLLECVEWLNSLEKKL